MNWKNGLLCLWVWLLPVVLTAQQEQWRTDFDMGNQAYKDGLFPQAIAAYEAVASTGLVSKEVYANLGNAYFKAQKWGLARVNYERALKLAPQDAFILDNIAVVKKQLKDDIEPIPDFILMRWWRSFHQCLRPDTWTWLGVLALWLGAAAFARWLLGTDRLWKKRGFIMGLGVLPLSIVLFSAAFSAQKAFDDTTAAIVTATEATVLAGPDALSSPLITIHEGLKVVCLDTIQGFVKVRLPNGEEGWLPTAVLMRI